VVGVLGLSDAVIEPVAAEEGEELARRERAHRGDCPAPTIEGRTRHPGG
jgi:hypothetical protein